MPPRRLVPCSPRFRDKWFITGWHQESIKRYLDEEAGYLDNWQPRKALFTGTGFVKKLVRKKVYEDARSFLAEWRLKSLPAEETRRILLLAGGEPAHEIALARRIFNKPHVVAFDLDERAVLAARAAGADLAVRVDIGNLRFKGPNTSPSCLTHDYDFINLDFCGLVTSKGVGVAIERAAHMSFYLATWFSYGHENGVEEMNKEAEIFSRGMDTHFEHLPLTVKNRLLHIWYKVQGSNPSPAHGGRIRLRAVKVWTYRDQRMPMMCILWKPPSFADDDSKSLPYENVKITKEDFKELVLREAETSSPEVACELYGIERPQLAAWRAVETRKRRQYGEDSEIRPSAQS